MRINLGAWSRALLWFVLAIVPARARAQDAGYALNIFDAAARGSEWFAGDSLDLRGHGRISAGISSDWAHRSLVIDRRDGTRPRAIVRNQLLVQPGLSVVLWQRLRLAADLPLLLYTDGNTLSSQGVRYAAPEQGVSPGDARVGAVLRLFGAHGDPLTAGLGLQVALPTGNRAAYVGDGSVRVFPQLLIAGDFAGFAYAARAGAAIRGSTHEVLGAHLGSYAYFVLAMGVRMFDRRFVLGPELLGQTLLNAGQFFKRRATPVEALLGLHYSFDNGLRLGAGIGFGVSSGLGAPEQRGLISLEWNTPLPPPASSLTAAVDSDRDSVLDPEDACTAQPGPRSANPLLSGCPVPVDTDHDGIRDLDDACPEHAGAASDDPAMRGCPKPKDSDQDGVVDAYDACPDQSGEATTDPQTTGCKLKHEDTE